MKNRFKFKHFGDFALYTANAVWLGGREAGEKFYTVSWLDKKEIHISSELYDEETVIRYINHGIWIEQ